MKIYVKDLLRIMQKDLDVVVIRSDDPYDTSSAKYTETLHGAAEEVLKRYKYFLDEVYDVDYLSNMYDLNVYEQVHIMVKI